MDRTVAELFAGVGGFRCAFNDVKLNDDGTIEEKDTWNFTYANQLEPSTKKQDAYDCYCARFGNKDVSNEDIFEVDKAGMPDANLVVGGFPCLVGSTNVLLSDGSYKHINEIVPFEDKVIGHDGKAHIVCNLFDQGVKPIFELVSLKEDYKVQATSNHRFQVKDKKGCVTWMSVSDIADNIDNVRVGIVSDDVDFNENANIEWVALSDIVDLHRNEKVFDIEVEEVHSFIANGFVSHNCQDYSVASTLRNSKGIEGKKGVLWWAINDILNEKQPPFVFLENVDRLLLSPSKQRGRDFGIILRCFFEADYDVQWRVINAGEYGYQQKRRRVYIVAYRNDTKYAKQMREVPAAKVIREDGVFAADFPIAHDFIKENESDVSKDAYEFLGQLSDVFRCDFYNAGVMCDGKIFTAKVVADCEDVFPLRNLLESDGVDERFFLEGEKLEKMRYMKSSKHIPRKKPNGEEYIYSEGAMAFPDNLDVPARTILTSESSTSRMSHVVADPKTGGLRILTPIECERIQGFPDGWTDTGMTEKRRYFMMGNALVVNLVAKIGQRLGDIIDNE